MSVNEIGGSVFDSLQVYAGITETEADDASLKKLTQLILNAVPGADADEVGKKIAELKEQNPTWTMAQVFEAAVTALNPACSETAINEIIAAWEAFTGVSDLSSDDISEILDAPATFAIRHSDTTHVSLKNALAILMQLLVEIVGKESANMMKEGAAEREFIQITGKNKADEIRTKGINDTVNQVISATGKVASGLVSAGFSGAGMKYAAAGNTAMSQAISQLGSALSSLIQGLSEYGSAAMTNESAKVEAKIAELDAESQAASIRKETDDQLKQAAAKVIDAVFSLLKLMGQADHQVMTAIGRA